MREPLGWVALAVGVLVSAEGIRTLIVFARHRDALGKAYLGTMLALFGASLVLRAPEVTSIVTNATGGPNLTIFVRGACSLGTLIGPAGLLGLSGWGWLRLRYVLAVVAAGTGVLAWTVFGEPRRSEGVELLGAVVWIGGAVPALAFAVYTMRIRKLVRQASLRLRVAGDLTFAGCLVCATGVAASLVAVVGGPDLTGGSAWPGLVVQGLGGVLIAAGSCFGEAAGLVEDVRISLENASVRRLWCYVEPIRRTMTDRLHVGGVLNREIIDIYDALLLAQQQSCKRVRDRAVLVAEAAGLGQRDRAEFLDAIELRAAVSGSCRFLGTGKRAPSEKLNIEVETDPLDVDALVQREKVVRLARRVLRDGMVRRTA
ncbi:hypothetical protein ACFXPA_36025 [Amycolatopsis sp. NPDC059090]|uniref:hypothetical protein n=1 Tax=unclassified Amycolatopsis TaxID=2618356 RepID=UPI0036714AB7